MWNERRQGALIGFLTVLILGWMVLVSYYAYRGQLAATFIERQLEQQQRGAGGQPAGQPVLPEPVK